MEYEIVMGLEVHVELATRTKIFCGCSTRFGGEPNAHVCPVCLGLPGSLPVLNRQVVDLAIKAGLALHCDIQKENRFDRKNYFYPDLPKDYQISQLYHPICQNGSLEVEAEGQVSRITIHEIHMEEDAGKLVHDHTGTLIDYNRCGVPLIEIVTNPDFRKPAQVGAFLEQLQETLKYLGVSDCKMEEGSMRADVNLSVRPKGSDVLGTRTEMKNLNSFKAVQRAIAYESERQIQVLSEGGTIHQETRRWDDEAGESYAMRSKENAQDYRYFPDPDLLPLSISSQWISEIRESLPELPGPKRLRYEREYGLNGEMAHAITASRQLAELYEAALTEGADPKLTATLMAGELPRLMKEYNVEPEKLSAGSERLDVEDQCSGQPNSKGLRKEELDGEGFCAGTLDSIKLSKIVSLMGAGKISRNDGKVILEEVFCHFVEPEAYAREHNMLISHDHGLLDAVTSEILAAHPQSAADYLAGKAKALDFLVGQSMRQLKGKAGPKEVSEALLQRLAQRESGAVHQTRQSAQQTEQSQQAQMSQNMQPGFGSMGDSSPEEKRSKAAAPSQEESSAESLTAAQKALRSLPAADQSGQVFEAGSAQLPGEYQISNRYRTKTCGQLTTADVGNQVRLAGWVQTIRNHGGIMFVDLRDHYGVTQVVVTAEHVERLSKETVISVTGQVVLRDPETVNPKLPTGQVELKAENMDILGACRSGLPFEVENSTDTREDIRLKYRFLDLRNQKMHDNILLRSRIIQYLRRQMDAMGFVEIQTPILANSSPEGARDYLVPSRKHKGMFYALPQAPQQFKQQLMASGFDRYYQIAPCFRDEDARADRSPGEFYQLDFEMAFATQEDVFAVAEQVLSEVFARFSQKKVTPAPFPRITYREAMLKYGTDKPDLRNPLIIMDLTSFFSQVEFKPFQGKPVRGIRVPGCAQMPKSFYERMEKFALGIGMKGLGYITVKEDMSYKGPIDKFMSEAQRKELAGLAELEANDTLYFISDEKALAEKYAGQIRTELGKRLDLIDESRFDFCYITDFPMFEINEETGSVDFTHNPFSMPQGEMEALLTMNPLDVKAYQYDIVVNGVELSSGAVRNHRPDVMVKAFEIAGYTEEDVKNQFGALYTAFQYGAPPHAGMAPGVDRMVMLLAEEENIREIIAFPLSSNGQDLLFGAPGPVDEKQLREVHIKIR